MDIVGNRDKKESMSDTEVNEREPGDQGSREKQEDEKEKDVPSHSTEKEKLKKKQSSSKKKEVVESLDEEDIKKLLSVKEELEEKNKLLLEYEDLLKRKQADFENYTKRVKREFDESKKYATAELMLDIINSIDNFERAIDSAKSSKDFDALLEGIIIIETQLKSVLEKKYGVVPFDDVGKEFDPNIHDAIMMEESDEYTEDTVVENLQKGYRMYDRIIRHAKVKVAKPAASIDVQEEPEDDARNISGKGV